MILGIFLTPGDSLEKQAKVGQDERFIGYYLKAYSQNFEKVFIFSYGDKSYKKRLPANVYLLANKYGIPYLVYQFLAPFLYIRETGKCGIFRVMQATGALPAFLTKLFFGKKFIVTYGYDYGKFAKIEGDNLRAFLLEIIVPLILSFVDKIIVTCKVFKKDLGRKHPGKVVYIPNGVDVGKLKAQSAKLKAKKKKMVDILSIGRLVKQKNFSLLLKAVAQSKYKEKIKITIIGDGPEREFLIRLAGKNKISLEIVKPVSHNKVVGYFQKADIFCLPSLAEGQSKVLLESLSCGLPCLASRIAGNQEIIKNGKNGLLFKLNSTDLRKKIDLLIEKPAKREKLGLAGRKFILKNHNIEKLLKKELKLLGC